MTVKAYRYDASGHDESSTLTADAIAGLNEDQLLWIDAAGSGADAEQLATALDIEVEVISRLLDGDRHERLDNHGTFYALSVWTFRSHEHRKVEDAIKLGLLVGKQWLVTLHEEPIDFLSAFQAQDKGETLIGRLSPSQLLTSLLDWHLAEFFNEVAAIEQDVDELDDCILADEKPRKVLDDIVAIRRRVSRLRALIAAQRPIFYGLTRADFTLNAERPAVEQFELLAKRFDRALDEVERSRDVVIGSFELFTSITTQETNELVKGLTFFTVLIGACAAVAGLLGMNFTMPIFETGTYGFIIVTAVMVAAAVIATVVARRRKWI